MARIYATSEQYLAYTGQATAPAGIDRLLTRASEDVDSALMTAVYDTDDDGMPTDTDITTALADAVCAQVEYQQETGDTGTGAMGQWDDVKIGPVALSGRRATGSAAGGVDLAPRAQRALSRAGLLPGVVW